MQVRVPLEPFGSLLLGPPSGISGKLLLDGAPLIFRSELFEFVCSNFSRWKIACERLQKS